HGSGDQRLSALGLAGGRPACGDADVAIRAAGGLIRIRRQYQVWDSPRFSSLVTDLARAVWANIERHERGLSQRPPGTDVGGFGEGDEKRRELITALLSLAPADRQRLRFLLSFRPRIVRQADVPWLLDTLARTQDAAPRAALLELLMMLFNPHD